MTAQAAPSTVRRAHLAAPTLLALAALAVALLAPTPASALPARELTVMTFNIAHARYAGGDLARIAATIRRARSDVVAVQEVDRSWSRSGGGDQAAQLARLLGMRHFFDPNLNCTARDTHADGFCQYGTAILSRHPFVAGSARQVRLPAPATEEPRGLARILVDVAGRRVEIFNTHLSFVELTRVRQMRYLATLLRRDRQAFVLAGDLNALPFHLEMVSLRRVARDAAIAAGRPDLRTTALANPVRLDYIMLPRPPIDGPPRRIEALDARVIYGPRVSDHRPLVARLRIPATP